MKKALFYGLFVTILATRMVAEKEKVPVRCDQFSFGNDRC